MLGGAVLGVGSVLWWRIDVLYLGWFGGVWGVTLMQFDLVDR